MEKQSMESLGFDEKSTWEYEQKSKEDTIRNIQRIMKESRERVREEFARNRK